MLYHYRVDLFCNVQSLEELGLDCTLPRKLNKRRKEHDFATKYSFLLLIQEGSFSLDRVICQKTFCRRLY